MDLLTCKWVITAYNVRCLPLINTVEINFGIQMEICVSVEIEPDLKLMVFNLLDKISGIWPDRQN